MGAEIGLEIGLEKTYRWVYDQMTGSRRQPRPS